MFAKRQRANKEFAAVPLALWRFCIVRDGAHLAETGATLRERGAQNGGHGSP